MATSQSLPNLDFLGLTLHGCVIMENEITVSYSVLRDSHRRLVNALREAKERESLLNERIHFLTVTLGEQQIGVWSGSTDMAEHQN